MAGFAPFIERIIMTSIRVRYQTIEFGSTDIHVCTLRDKQQFSDPDGIAESLGITSALWPLFGVIWPSGLVLAHLMHNTDTGTKRILEVGCGMALSSLLLNKRDADITATDYHPDAEKYLIRNAILNNSEAIAYERVDWADNADGLGMFDLIIGSDLLYEDQHILLLANFINCHANPTCDVILVDPSRGRKTKLSNCMKDFGFTSTHEKSPPAAYLDQSYKGDILRFSRVD